MRRCIFVEDMIKWLMLFCISTFLTWAPSLGTQTNILASESLWIRNCCMASWWGTISYDYCIYQSFRSTNLLCKQYDYLQVLHVWDQKPESSKSDACVYIWVCKQLLFYPLYLHYSCHFCRCSGCWTLCLVHYIRCPTDTINICCQKENRFLVVPFKANDVLE